MALDIKDTLGNPAWRVNRIYSIVDKNSERVPYRMNSIQKMIHKEKSKRKIILKARQFGVSTHCLIDMFDNTIWNRNITSCVIAHEKSAVKKLFRIIRRAYDFLHPDFRPALDRGGGSQYEMYFPGINSRIYCDLESRGDTINRLHVSEAAFIKDPERIKATLQAVPIDTGKVTIETTPNGMGTHFYDLWVDKTPDYKKLFYPWFLFAEYQIPCLKLDRTPEEKSFAKHAWQHFGITITDEQIMFRRAKQSELKGSFVQEYPEDDQSCFLSSGGAAMDLVTVKELYDNVIPPLEDRGHLKIYEKYDRSEVYACGVDTAEGVRSDNSVAVMFKARTMEQVATLVTNNMKPAEFAEAVDEFCRMYWMGGRWYPLLGVERNNHGHAVLQKLNDPDVAYPNLFYAKDERCGWLTDKVTRPIMIDAFINGVENKTITLKDKDTLGECLTLVVDNGKIEAADGKHDDRVIASAIGIQMCLECSKLDAFNDIANRIRV